MSDYKILFVLDDTEFRYFGFHKLVTSFWLLKEAGNRGWETYVTNMHNLFLVKNVPEAIVFKGSLTSDNGKGKNQLGDSERIKLNDFDMILFRPDPPVNMNYIYCTYILDNVDHNKTIVVNNPSGIRKANEKFYINTFPEYIPYNISTSNINLIKEFIDQYGKVVVKPLNKCVGKGVFYIEKGDKNTNAILESATEYGKNCIMVQQFIDAVNEGEKRLTLLGGKLIDEAIMRVPNGVDFRLNLQKDEFLKKAFITDTEREICDSISTQLLEDKLYLVGLDVIGNKITEINVTSPAFFIKECNAHFNTKLEVKIVNYLEELIYSRKPVSVLTV